MMHEHTSTYWYATFYDDPTNFVVCGDDGEGGVLQILEGTLWGETTEEIEANGRLIAAAPELLAACRAILEYSPTGDYSQLKNKPGHLQAVDKLKSAIGKAEGKPLPHSSDD